MIRGLYVAASGMMLQIVKNDVYAANLANVSTIGYRRSCIGQQSFALALSASGSSPNTDGALRGGVQAIMASLDMTAGPIVQTGNDFDIAIDGQGFFCVQTLSGEAYTANGQMQLDSRNILVNRSGQAVLGSKGPIQITTGQMKVDESGQVWDGDKLVDTLRIMTFDTPESLRKQAGGLLVGGRPRPAEDYKVVQGATEGSNVQAMVELQKMMAGMRLYEANARTLQVQDQSIETLLREAVG